MESSTAAVCELPAKLELGAQLYRKKKAVFKNHQHFSNSADYVTAFCGKAETVSGVRKRWYTLNFFTSLCLPYGTANTQKSTQSLDFGAFL